MTRATRLLLLLFPLLLAADWPQWRGPNSDGTTTDTGFPVEWDATTGKNIRWKVKLPGVGNSSPVVMGQDIVVTASSGRDHRELHVLCANRETGAIRWQTDLIASPADAPFSMFPPERGHAACTPIITETRIFALFSSGDLACLDRAGKPLWLRSISQEYGRIRNDYGLASSPILVEGRLILQVDHLEGSYLLAVDAKTGATAWKTARTGIYDNWSTPVAMAIQGKTHIVTLGTKLLRSYDAATGQQLLTAGGLERLCSPTPIVRGDKLYAVSGPGGANIAYNLGASGSPKVLWESKKTGPFIPSAIVANDLYFVADDQGNVSCLDVKTGVEKWKERLLNGRMRPSPILADGRIFFTALDGATVVIKAAAELEIVGKSKLGEEIATSFAATGGQFIVRTDRHLICLSGR
jgi:outer membrane protein assembly factor BamB